eukprot:TRINITY_DN18820_c0_g2_i2.p1 TRINITY_DN18820_c0_g2~~TRINITY_DN18820_c0_g2_i2.p1  ORF type:complete len:403 (-),score=97.34 TRINITY_DN18820_c0_g2_i2:28-1236(-)
MCIRDRYQRRVRGCRSSNSEAPERRRTQLKPASGLLVARWHVMTDWGALGPKDQAKVTKLFQLIDFDKDGIISYPEVRAANGGDPDGTMQKMFKKLDKNKDGQASMDEWIKFWVALHKAKGDKPFGKFIKALASAAMANNPPAPKEVAGQSAELSPEAVGLASELFGLLDLDANGGVSVDEFTVAHGSSGGMWSVLDHNQDGVLSLREVLSVLGVMQTKKGHDCVVYYIKHMMSVIRDNQIDNPKAKGVSLAGKCSHVYHNRTSKIRALGDTIKTVNSAMVDALEQNRAAELLANEEALVSTRGPELLMLACWKGDTAAVDELLMAGVDPNACDTDGFTALMYAILADQTGSMKALYKGDTDGKLDLCFQDKTGATALMVACLLYTSPSPRDRTRSRMPSSA